jgi:hypothetical protein
MRFRMPSGELVPAGAVLRIVIKRSRDDAEPLREIDKRVETQSEAIEMGADRPMSRGLWEWRRG